MAPSQIDQENYVEFLTILKAKPRDKRPMNAGEAHKKLARLMSN
ncbi:hypothetical protein [Limosilactobacillus vaginalis]